MFTKLENTSENMRHFLDLLWGMTEKELKARYKHTLFGFLWIVINPLLQMVVIGFIMRFFIKNPVPFYYHYLFTGLLIWNFFTLSLTKATPSIVNERGLIKKARFPHSIIPLSIILSNFIHTILAFILFLIPILFIGTFSWMKVPLLFAASLMLMVFTIGFSLLTSALNVRFRDVNFFVQALLIVWFYATPIIYSITEIPYDLMWVWRLNPLTSIVQLFQYALVDAPSPGFGMLSFNISIITISFILGIFIFHKESKNFDDWV